MSALRGSFTPLYASPQQASGSAPDPRDDVFALGVIWYQILTGRLDQGRPGGMKWPRSLEVRRMSSALIELLVSCFEDDPADRPEDGQALARASLAEILSPPIPEPPPVPPVDEPKTAVEYNNRGIDRYVKDDYDGAIADSSAALRLDPKFAAAPTETEPTPARPREISPARSPTTTRRFVSIRSSPSPTTTVDSPARPRVILTARSPTTTRRFVSIRSSPSPTTAVALPVTTRRITTALLADYDAAVRLDPKYAFAYNNRGLARQAKGDLDGAIADYDAAVRLDPKYTFAYYNRGIARYDRKDYDGALADYDAAVRLDPKYAAAYYNRGLARKAKGDLNGAAAIFRRRPASPLRRRTTASRATRFGSSSRPSEFGAGTFQNLHVRPDATGVTAQIDDDVPVAVLRRHQADGRDFRQAAVVTEPFALTIGAKLESSSSITLAWPSTETSITSSDPTQRSWCRSFMACSLSRESSVLLSLHRRILRHLKDLWKEQTDSHRSRRASHDSEIPSRFSLRAPHLSR